MMPRCKIETLKLIIKPSCLPVSFKYVSNCASWTFKSLSTHIQIS